MICRIHTVFFNERAGNSIELLLQRTDIFGYNNNLFEHTRHLNSNQIGMVMQYF